MGWPSLPGSGGGDSPPRSGRTQGVVAGLDIDLLGFDGDVALGRDHLAGGLGVPLTRAQGDVAAQRGDLAAHLVLA